MNKTTKLRVGIASAAILATVGIAPFAFAQSDEVKEQMEAWRTSIEESVTNGDYSAWSTLMSQRAEEMRTKMLEGITEENFSTLQEIQKLEDAGDYDAARELREELDLPGFGGRRGHGGPGGGPMGDGGKMAEVLESGDYDAWVDLMNNRPEDKGKMADVEITEDTFNKMVEAHTLRQSGDEEGAWKIMDALRGE
jgi:hypothetical protein